MGGRSFMIRARQRRERAMVSSAAAKALEEPRQLSGAGAMFVVAASRLLEQGRANEAQEMLAQASATLDQEIDVLQNAIQAIDTLATRPPRSNVRLPLWAAPASGVILAVTAFGSLLLLMDQSGHATPRGASFSTNLLPPASQAPGNVVSAELSPKQEVVGDSPIMGVTAVTSADARQPSPPTERSLVFQALPSGSSAPNLTPQPAPLISPGVVVAPPASFPAPTSFASPVAPIGPDIQDPIPTGTDRGGSGEASQGSGDGAAKLSVASLPAPRHAEAGQGGPGKSTDPSNRGRDGSSNKAALGPAHPGRP